MIGRLSKEQRRRLLELMLHLAKSDGHLDDVERRILSHYAYVNGVESVKIQPARSMKEMVAAFDTPASRVIVLSELLRLSHAGEYFEDSKKSELVDVAAMMGIPMDLLAKIEEWVVERLDMERRAVELLEEAEAVVRH